MKRCHPMSPSRPQTPLPDSFSPAFSRSSSEVSQFVESCEDGSESPPAHAHVSSGDAVLVLSSQESCQADSQLADADDDDSDAWITIARALGVDLTVAPIETLAYTMLCKHKRSETLSKQQLLELWDAFPKKFIRHDKNTLHGRLVVFGVNPRSTAQVTAVTTELPNVYSVLRAFVEQSAPGFRFSCVCIRQDGMRLPHRDMKNVGDSFAVTLTDHESGGGLWISDPQGDTFQVFQGGLLPGRIQSLSDPYVFSARSILHATQPWRETRRVVLVAFTPLGSVKAQATGFWPRNVRQKTLHDFFHQASRTD